MKKIFFRIALITGFIVILTTIIAFARGYRIDIDTQSITSTGILATSSSPKAAKVYVNGELKGVTDLNLNLPPGKYKVEIKKEGYAGWSKDLTLRGEIVTTANALLFPKNPSLSPLTSTGIIKAINLDQTGKILLFIQSDEIEKNGIYLFESAQRTLSFTTRLKPIILNENLPSDTILSESDVYFSPDYSQAILEYESEKSFKSFLFSLEAENSAADLLDTTNSKETFIAAWEERKSNDIAKILETFPDGIAKIASDSFKIISFSPDETKVIYSAGKKTSLPLVIDPPLIGANQTPENRTLQKGLIYIYDRKEDKNIKLDINGATTTLQWHPDSRHIALMEKNKILIADYDGSNKRTVYSGPLTDEYFLMTANGTIIILSNLNPQNNLYPDIYEVDIQ